MPAADEVAKMAYDRDELLGIAMFESAGIDAFKRRDSRKANPEDLKTVTGWAWDLGWRRARFLAEIAGVE